MQISRHDEDSSSQSGWVRFIGVAFVFAFCICVTLLATIRFNPEDLVEIPDYGFKGCGSVEQPFQIETPQDLVVFRDAVNHGESFEDKYFRQTADIDLTDCGNWTPIGEYKGKRYFKGVYDGGGHVVYGLSCEGDGNNGLFGCLLGSVYNLGLKGTVSGAYCGGIASHGSPGARIVNCFNAASVAGSGRAGGIADNFAGKIIMCVNVGNVASSSNIYAGIVSYDANAVLYCFSIGGACVSEKYTGIITGSGVGDCDDLELFLDNLYSTSEAHFNVLNDAVDIIPMSWGDDGISYAVTDLDPLSLSLHAAPAAHLAWLPLALLSLAAIGFISLAWKRRPFRDRPKNHQSGEVGHIDKEPLMCKRAALSISIVLCIALVGGAGLNSVLVLKRDDGVMSMKNYYDQENGTVDVLLLGSSQIGLCFDVEELWSGFGISSYSLWGSSQPFWNSYYFLREALKSGKPQVVVLEVRAASKDIEYSDEGRQYTNTFGMNLSGDKLRAIQVSAFQERWLDLLLGFPIYHGRYGELSEGDFALSNSVSYKGGWSRYGSVAVDDSASAMKEGKSRLPAKEERYLRAIISQCAECGVPLLLVSAPASNRGFLSEYNNAVRAIAVETNVGFLDFNVLDGETGFNSMSDFYFDGDHLNTGGARKISDYLAIYLQKYYGVSDHRGDKTYSSWDEFARSTQNTYIQQIFDVNDYLAELSRDGRTVVFIKHGVSEFDSGFKDLIRNSAKAGLDIGPLSSLSDGFYVIDDSSVFDQGRFESYSARLVTLSIDGSEAYVGVDSAGCVDVNGDSFGLMPAMGVVAIVFDSETGALVDVSQLYGADVPWVGYYKDADVVYYATVKHLLKTGAAEDGDYFL